MQTPGRPRAARRSETKRAGTSASALARLEAGGAEPRIGTLDRVLAACGYVLELHPRLGAEVDRGPIRRLLAQSPLSRLRIQGADRVVGVLAARRVRFVVEGALAERLHGSPEPVDAVEVAVLARDEARLDAAAARLQEWRRFVRPRVAPRFLDPESWGLLARPAGRVDAVRVASIDDLIRARRGGGGGEAGRRLAVLHAVREEARL